MPDIGNIYILLRSKKSENPTERINGILKNKLFDVLRKSNQNVFQKIVPIEGDVAQLRLGISAEDRQVLIENVNIIYHCAASIRFDDHLDKAIVTNTRSTRDIIHLAQELRNLQAFVHVSTAYCHTDKPVVEETAYDAPGNWIEAIAIAEEDPEMLRYFSQKYIYPLPNTYTYTKLLAENLVCDLCDGKLPAVIVRPTMVINAACEPLPGWTDNLNGPLGLSYGAAIGLLRKMALEKDAIADLIPVDAVINNLFLCTWKILDNPKCKRVEIYNSSRSEIYPVTYSQYAEYGMRALYETPPSQMIFYPGKHRNGGTTSKFVYFWNVILFHIIPALFLDMIIRISGGKPRLYKLQKKIYIATTVVAPFTLRTWYFKNDKVLNLEKQLSSEDLQNYGFTKILHSVGKNPVEFMKNVFIQTEECVFNVNYNLEKSKKKMLRLWILDRIASVLWYVFLFAMLFKTNVIPILYKRLEGYISRL